MESVVDAGAEGADPSEVGNRSVRLGGASALWAAHQDTGRARRRGRWARQACHGQLWESRSAAEGVAQEMSEVSLATR